MKVTIERDVLFKALSHVQSVVERRNTIQILSNVLLRTDGQSLSLTATDLDMEVVETVAADVAQGGATTASAHTLHEIVRRLPDGAQVNLALGGDDPRLRLTCGRAEFLLAVLPGEDFPTMDQGDLPVQFGLSARDYKRLVDKARFAISTEETRYYLNGIYFHTIEQDGAPWLRAVATDGHRLARLEMPAPDGSAGMPGVIVPRKTVLGMSRLLDDEEGTVRVSLSTAKIRFTYDDIVLTSKLVDGTFPDYERVIPRGNDRRMKVKGDLFSQSVDRVSSISVEKTRAVKLALVDDQLTMTVSNPESGNAVETVSVTYSAEPLEIGFNARYLLDVTGQLEGEGLIFSMSDPGAPTIIEDSGDDHALYVLMPMRV